MTILVWLSWRRVRHGLLAGFITLLLLTVGVGEFRPSNIGLLVAPYQYNFVGWELSHLPDKWSGNLKRLIPGGQELSRAEKIAQVQEFFDLGLELSRLQSRNSDLQPRDGIMAQSSTDSLSSEEAIQRIQKRRGLIRAQVEHTIEEEISKALSSRGLTTPVGVFPPVDAVFSSSPHVLVLSPRDRIFRQEAILLEAGLTDEDKESLEARIFQTEDLAALVENTGGVAVYPSVVSDTVGLHHALVTTAHEWTHHWFFFRPLGRSFWSSPEMTTLNETAATLAGEELGDLVYAEITGKSVDRGARPNADSDAEVFDFDTAMRETRRQTDDLLAQDKVEEAEAYMEERRQLLVSHGYRIRKINQAYFAFHGSYATSPSSVSPIGEQMRELRRRSDSLEDFLRTVAQFGSYQEFLDYLSGPPGE